MTMTSAPLLPETLSLVVAVARNGVIGANNALPWHLPDDLRYFKRVTLGKPVIMGRKTFVSIGRPLPGRPNIVLTRDTAWTADGVEAVHSFPAALAAAAAHGPEAMVIGGADLFALGLPLAQRLYLTEVFMDPAGDVHFPAFARDAWQETARTPGEPAADGTHTHDFVVLERR
ncbi:dihydrofolate reductase [Novispirillum itersonii]|uniref:dihydrofolate reductase n=1 Tax=Novispirillum itersonii TaxID=189 RepID=UPI00037D7C58|nr:dihydrofolate reductase [Novispirillum itersonii]